MRSQERIQCPVCPPFKSASLSIDRVRGLFHCFRCGYSGKTKGQLRFDLLNDAHIAQVNFLPWPEYYKPLDPYQPETLQEKFALKYLERRRITKDQILKYKIGYCPRGRYERRVIVPFFVGKELKYFVARSINPNEPRKYLNPAAPKGSFVFKTFVGRVQVAAVVEGVFDALSVEHEMPAIACLGKNPTQEQVDAIREHTEKAIVLLDADAHRDALLLEQRIGFHIPTTKVLLRSGDPGALRKGELHAYLS